MSYVGKFVGTLRYGSVNAHLGIQLSRRDDIISLMYMMAHITREDGVPWDIDKGMQHVLRLK